jgi:pimeloyl-ACP methyl ester carboxylesterase
MYFDKKGSGPAVVLIHGLGAYSFSWRETAAALSKRFTTYAVDLLGFGQSAAPAGFAYTAQAQAEAVTAFMKTQGLSSPIIIGHSMGGGVCLYLARQAGLGGAPKPSKMVLVDPVASPPAPPPAGGKLAQLVAAIAVPGVTPPDGPALAKAVLEWAYAPASPVTSEQIDGYAKGLSTPDQRLAFRNHLFNLGQIAFSDAELGGIDVETLVIWGKDDRVLPITRGEHLRGVLPKASLKPIDCGHIPHEERPMETNNFIESFLK